MRSKYFIWWLIPFIILGSIIIDLRSYKNGMILASVYFIPFALILALVGGIYYLLREKKHRSKTALILIDLCTVYTVLVSILPVLLALLSSFGFNVYFLKEFNWSILWPMSGVALYSFGLVQLAALTLLLLDF